MFKFILSLIVWVVVFSLTALFFKLLGFGELLQGGLGAIMAIHIDRYFINNQEDK